MKFAIVVRAGPLASEGSRSALRFARAVLASGHSLERVFFHGEGTYNASSLTVAPQDEDDLTEAWAELGRQQQLDLVICVASALKRGVLDEREAERYDKAGANMRPEFVISGLGQLADAALSVDRLVTFGG
ncbi:MAG: sulfurtransferase complex subunit TusD [Gammaproteobacteria bacterium]|nr:sulfurtransferase complex subunit TusD [Gammaproteobacteria bacterium]